jgi:hypothetical protein
VCSLVASQTMVSAASSGLRGASGPPMSVRVWFGHIASTNTPRLPFPSSAARFFVNAFTAVLEIR